VTNFLRNAIRMKPILSVTADGVKMTIPASTQVSVSLPTDHDLSDFFALMECFLIFDKGHIDIKFALFLQWH
jgi:hypothetical protein